MIIKIPFVGPTYQARSLNADAEETINCYTELSNTSQRAPIALYGTPGTVLKEVLPKSPIRGCISFNTISWWIAGDTVYQIMPNFSYIALGKIGTKTGNVGLASNGQQILIVDGTGGWILNISSPATTVFTQITDPAFPVGVTQATFQDGWFLVAGDGTGKFYKNKTPYNGLVWNGLDFATAEGSPDNLIGIMSDHQEVWLFGTNSVEIWVDTGAQSFPFQRSGNAFIEHGCAAPWSIAKLDNTLFWLGSDDRGGGTVWRANGYTPARVSNHAMEAQLATYSTITDAIAMTYQQEGHLFYVLTFPTANVTWVYDVATDMWHKRAWRDPSTAFLNRWRPSCLVYVNGMHLVGDWQNGNIYQLDMGTYTDNGELIKRLRRTTTTEQMQQRMFYAWLQIDMETGVGIASGTGQDPQMVLRFSNDGGHTWSNEKYSSMGKMGQYSYRCQFKRLGAGRNRVWEISTTNPVKFAVLGAVADVEQGMA